MKNIGLIISFAFCFNIMFAQNQEQISSQTAIKNTNLSISQTQIIQLKESVLLVRLHTKKASIKALREIGKNYDADIVEKKQFAENIRIIKAFRHYYNFCDVYFFFSEYSNNIINKEFDKVIFINDSLIDDTAINPDLSSFFIAEFSNHPIQTCSG